MSSFLTYFLLFFLLIAHTRCNSLFPFSIFSLRLTHTVSPFYLWILYHYMYIYHGKARYPSHSIRTPTSIGFVHSRCIQSYCFFFRPKGNGGATGKYLPEPAPTTQTAGLGGMEGRSGRGWAGSFETQKQSRFTSFLPWCVYAFAEKLSSAQLSAVQFNSAELKYCVL